MPAIEQQIGFGYEGIASFCRMPMCFDLNELEADIAIVGICLDSGTSNRSGARFGPRAIREASMLYSMGYTPQAGFFDIELRKHVLAGIRINDCGDIPTLPTLLAETLDIITQSIRDLRSRGVVPVVLGGDH
jgi:agmatinase